MSEIKGLDQVSQLSDEQLQSQLEQPNKTATDMQGIQNEIDDFKKYGNKSVEAAVLSGLSSATFGLSDQALVKSGAMKPEDLKKIKEQNPVASGVGTVGGIIVPSALSGGTSLAAKGVSSGVSAASKAGLAAERAVQKALNTAIKESGNKTLAKEIVKKTIEKGAGSAVEGSFYGAGQLVSENALGDAEFNADNLLAYAGGGALLSGALGSTLGAISPVVTSGAQKAKTISSRVAEKYMNPQRDAQKYFGIADKEILKNPKLMDDVVDYSKTRLGLKWQDTLETTAAKNSKVKQAAIKELDDIYNQVGDNVIDASVLRRVADSLETQFVKDKANLSAFGSVIAPVKKNIKDLRKIADKEGFLTIKELRQVRQLQDDLAQKFYKSLDPTDAGRAAFAARSLLKDELSQAVTSINKELGERLSIANKDYSIAERLEKSLDKKLAKDKDLVGFKDLVLGGISTGALGVEGLLIPAAQRFIESDLKRKLVILSGIEKSNKAIDSKVKSAATKFFEKTASVAKPASIGILTKSYLSQSDKGKSENRKDAFKNVSKNIIEYATNPELYETKIVKSVYPVSLAAPETANVLKNKSAQIIEFLYTKLPKDISDNVLDKPFKREYEPSTMEMAKFERYLQIIEAPMTVIDEIEQGTLTREHVEALSTIYPKLYDRVREQIMEEVRTKESIPYTKKIQLGILFNMATDASLAPQNLLALQSNFNTQPQSSEGVINPTAGGAAKLNMAERQGTELQKVMERE